MPINRNPIITPVRAPSGATGGSPDGLALTPVVLSLNHELWAGTLPSPEDLGLKGDWLGRGWRMWQEAAVMTSLDALTRVVIERLPTGAGKTLIYIAEALLNGGRVVILTSTKGQQDQICRSFADLIERGVIADVRGQMNYRCDAVMPGGEFSHLNERNAWTPVADGPCQDGAVCGLKDGGCGYYDAIRRAKRARIVVTNYAFWMTNKSMEPRWDITNGQSVDLLICDEAHEAVEEVCGFLSEEITEQDAALIEGIADMNCPDWATLDQDIWADWARRVGSKLTGMLMEREIQSPRQKKQARKTLNKMEKVGRIDRDSDNWVVQAAEEPKKQKYLVRFDPVWPKQMAEGMLMRGAKKVIMSSATVTAKTAELLGIQADDVTMFESPSSFPIQRRPIWRVPCMQMNWRTESAEGGDRWTKTAIRIVTDGRRDRNGLVHTTSYKRRNVLMMAMDKWNKEVRQYSEPRIRNMTHDSTSAAARIVVEQLQSASMRSRLGTGTGGEWGAVLISPSLTTGYDFPYSAAEYQIIPKLPILDTKSNKVLKVRQQQDKEYGAVHTGTQLMQMTGRVVRAEDDQGETFITDDNIVWWLAMWGKRIMARWWLEAYKDWSETMEWAKGRLPKAPERLQR